MKILDFEQGSIDWVAARKGIPTASRFSDICTAKTGALSASAKKYAAELLVERNGFETPHFTTEAMEHGIVTEKTARDWFEFQYDVDVTQVGMVTTDDGRIACSPDGLIYSGDMLCHGWECKCPLAKTHMLYNMDASQYRIAGGEACPVAETAGTGNAICLEHQWLASDDKTIDTIGDIVAKVADNAEALREQP